MVSVAMNVENICELVFTHRGESLKFILDRALSDETPYFSVDSIADLTFDWPNETVEWVNGKKIEKSRHFCFKLIPPVVQKHQLDEVRNKIIRSSCIFAGIFLPKNY